MGDRANIYLTNEYGQNAKRGIYLYTHWNGSEWPEFLRKALVSGRDLWDDYSHLSRIIISSVFADVADTTTGGGVSLSIQDNEHPIIVVDLSNQLVAFAQAGAEITPSAWYGIQSFATYADQEKATYPQTSTV